MEEIGNSIPNKVTGDKLTANEVNLLKNKTDEIIRTSNELEAVAKVTSEEFNVELTFEKNKYTSNVTTQSGPIAYTLAATGHKDGIVIRHKILSDGSPISFPNGSTVYPSNPVFEAGVVYSIWMIYLGGDVEVSIPGMAVSSPEPEPDPSIGEVVGATVEVSNFVDLVIGWTSAPATSVEILYTQGSAQPDSQWQKLVVPESDKEATLTGLSGGIWYIKLRAANGVNFGETTATFQRTLTAPDTAGPIFDSSVVSDVTQSTALFKTQINEAGIIYCAAYPTADPVHTIAEIKAGTGAASFTNKLTAGNILETISIEGLSQSVAYRLHYMAEDSEGNASSVFVSSEFTTDDFITISDDFEDGVIDTNKFSITNETPAGVTFTEANGKLEIAQTGIVATDDLSINYISSVASVQNGAFACKIDRGTPHVSNVFRIAFGSDLANMVAITRSLSSSNINVKIFVAGTSVFSSDYPFSMNNHFKLTTDPLNNIRIYCWNSGAWEQIRATQNYNLGAPKKAFMFANSASGQSVVNRIDSFRLTNFDYETQYPS